MEICYTEKKNLGGRFMKEKLAVYWRYIRRAFIPAKDYVRQERADIYALVYKRIVEVNCRRIVATSPIFFLLYAGNILLLLGHRNTYGEKVSVVATAILAVFTLLVVIAINRIIQISDNDDRPKNFLLKGIYRIFWPIWFTFMVLLACIQMQNDFIGFYVIVTCIMINLIPLYHLNEFVITVAIEIIVLFTIIPYDLNEGLMVAKIGLTSFFAMQFIGFAAQNMQTRMWVSREYLYMEAFIDPLTELLNRRGGNALLAEEIQKLHTDTEVGVIMLDVDYFKTYNDTFGHDAGDECLRTVGGVIREVMHLQTNLVIRHGGEEFVVILMDTNEKELRKYAEKLRLAVYEKKLEAPVNKIADYMTISVGAAMKKLERENQRYENILKEADEALYKAKKAGRNRVVVARK